MKLDSQHLGTYTNYTNYTNTTHEGEFKCKKCKKSNDQTPDKYLEMIKETLNKIKLEYVPGTLEYVNQYYNKAYQKILDARKKVNTVYKARLHTKYPSTIIEFKHSLDVLYTNYIKVITLYKGHLDDRS
jgi:hypothetical protein